MAVAAWAAWLDTLLAQGERRAACWGHFSWNRISGQVSWAPWPGAGPCPTMLRLKLGELFPTQGRCFLHRKEGTKLDHTQKMVPDLGLMFWQMNLKCSSWKNFWMEIVLEILSHFNLWFLSHSSQSFTTVGFPFFNPVLYRFAFLAEPSATLAFPWEPSFSQGSYTPEAPIFNPKHCNCNSANKNWTSQHGHFCLLKGGLHYLLVAPEGQAGLLLSACFLI